MGAVSYYDDKIEALSRLFGTSDIQVWPDKLRIAESTYDVIDDVIIALPGHLRPGAARSDDDGTFPRDIQNTFGREWQRFNEVLPEQRTEFDQYFDILDLTALPDAFVCDLGAGMGRWSYFLAQYCRQLALVDFSDAIFVARHNLRDVENALFLMADITALPFANDSCDLAICLGVLHTLPEAPLSTVRSLERISPRLLIYLMYAVDNRPAYFQHILRAVTVIRTHTAKISNERARRLLVTAIAVGVYRPLIAAGQMARFLGIRHPIPLADNNVDKSLEGIRQVVYDRFFTSIEQRVTSSQINALSDTFSNVLISANPPYWHFECTR